MYYGGSHVKILFYRVFKNWVLEALVAGLLCLTAAPLYAAQVTLQWDANNPTPGGYSLYQRQAGAAYNYNTPAWTGMANTCTVASLQAGKTYYYVVRAYQGTTVSGDSNEVQYAVPVPQDVDKDGYTEAQGDCNDNNASIHPGKVKILRLIFYRSFFQ